MAAKKKDDTPEETEANTAAGEEGGEGEVSKKGKNKLVFIIGGLVVVIAIVAGLFLSGMLGGGEKKVDEHGAAVEELSEEEQAARTAAALAATKPVYYELPEFLVNLNSTSNRVSFLKMSVTLELKDAATVITMDANKPRIQDIFNTYLRELRASDIQGSAGIYRLRTELITRLNSTIEEGAVKDILFSEIIVQ
jgi:flagellar FliL protein